MNNERVTFFKKTSNEIENLPITSGQIIFDITNNKLYLDKNDEDRIQIEGLFDEDDLTKLNGIESGAEVNLIETIKMNGTALTISNKSVNITSVPASILTGAIKNGVTATTQAQTDNSTKVATTAYVRTAVDTAASNLQTQIDELPNAMVFKGSLGSGGTISSLPTAATANEGWTYKVITTGTYNSQAAKVGDMFISDGTQWIYIPSADEPSGTVTSITLTGTSPISITDNGTAIITSGSRTISHATSGVTAGSYGDNSNQTPDYGETFKVPYISVNNTGHVTTASEHTVTIPKMKSYYGTPTTWGKTAGNTGNFYNLVNVTCEDFSLDTGVSLFVKFSSSWSSVYTSGLYMNVNNTGEKLINWGITTNGALGYIVSNEVLQFLYDGTNYRYIGNMTASTNSYGSTKLSTSTSSTATNLAATPSAVKAAYDLANTANTAAGTNATAISAILDGTTIDSFADVETALNSKQNSLVSGTNIKTINNTSLLGSGNIDVATIANIPTKISDLTNDSDFVHTEVDSGDGQTNQVWNSGSSAGIASGYHSSISQVYCRGGYVTIIGQNKISLSQGPIELDAKGTLSLDSTSTLTIGKDPTVTVPLTNIKGVVDPVNNYDAVNKRYVDTAIVNKQDTLIDSGTDQNIKTINGVSLLGSGDITISTGGTITIDDQLSSTSENPVQNKVINNALANKVNAESGKGLSTNDYSTSEKNKLSGIATGAQVNVIETIKVNNTALTPSSKAVNITVPTKVSDLTNDSGFISSYTETDPVYSASAAAGITSSDITNWNNKTSNTGTITGVSANGTSVATSGVANIPAASTSAYGVTQLSSSTSSTSTTLAATPSAVKAAYDRASTAITNASTNATAITNIKDGTNLDSFGDVESALANKADSTSVTSQISALSDEIYDNCELVSNKSTSITSSSTNIQYPTAKAVYDYTPRTYSGSGDPDNTIGKNGDIYIQI